MSATQKDVWRQPFRLDVVPERDVVRMVVSGEIDLATIGRVQARVDELVASGFRRLVLDLRTVTFLDSSGLHLILELVADAGSRGWEFAVIEGPAAVQRVFDLAGVRERVPFVEPAQVRHGRWRQP
jgi:anti-sigma B factor antagonist